MIRLLCTVTTCMVIFVDVYYCAKWGLPKVLSLLYICGNWELFSGDAAVCVTSNFILFLSHYTATYTHARTGARVHTHGTRFLKEQSCSVTLEIYLLHLSQSCSSSFPPYQLCWLPWLFRIILVCICPMSFELMFPLLEMFSQDWHLAPVLPFLRLFSSGTFSVHLAWSLCFKLYL